MKARELRIDNWVSVKSGIGQVSAIDPNEETFGGIVENEDQSVWERILGDLDFIEPIQLTEGWLLKFGFDKHDGVFSSYMLWFESPFQHAFLNADVLGEIKFPCRYVHQLQNLYFALTGEELTLKKD